MKGFSNVIAATFFDIYDDGLLVICLHFCSYKNNSSSVLINTLIQQLRTQRVNSRSVEDCYLLLTLVENPREVKKVSEAS